MSTTNETTNLQAIPRFTYAEWKGLSVDLRERLAFLAPILPPIPRAGDPTPCVYADKDGRPRLLAFRSGYPDGAMADWPITTHKWDAANRRWDSNATYETEDELTHMVAELQVWQVASTEPEPAAEPAA